MFISAERYYRPFASYFQRSDFTPFFRFQLQTSPFTDHLLEYDNSRAPFYAPLPVYPALRTANPRSVHPSPNAVRLHLLIPTLPPFAYPYPSIFLSLPHPPYAYPHPLHLPIPTPPPPFAYPYPPTYAHSLCTTLSIQWEPEIIAVALIYLASRMRMFPILDWEGKSNSDSKWWQSMNPDLSKKMLEGWSAHNDDGDGAVRVRRSLERD